MRITDDVKRFSEMCYCVGVMSGNLNEEWADDMADDVVTYITQLFSHAQELSRHEQDIDVLSEYEYEEEVNALKDEVNRWKEEYQEEHLLRLKVQEEYDAFRKMTSRIVQKAAEEAEGCMDDYSHHPQRNVYGG